MVGDFKQATIIYPQWDDVAKKNDFLCHPIARIDSPVVQHMLDWIEEGDMLNIKNLGVLVVREVMYTKKDGLCLSCNFILKEDEKNVSS